MFLGMATEPEVRALPAYVTEKVWLPHQVGAPTRYALAQRGPVLAILACQGLYVLAAFLEYKSGASYSASVFTTLGVIAGLLALGMYMNIRYLVLWWLFSIIAFLIVAVNEIPVVANGLFVLKMSDSGSRVAAVIVQLLAVFVGYVLYRDFAKTHPAQSALCQLLLMIHVLPQAEGQALLAGRRKAAPAFDPRALEANTAKPAKEQDGDESEEWYDPTNPNVPEHMKSRHQSAQEDFAADAWPQPSANQPEQVVSPPSAHAPPGRVNVASDPFLVG